MEVFFKFCAKTRQAAVFNVALDCRSTLQRAEGFANDGRPDRAPRVCSSLHGGPPDFEKNSEAGDLFTSKLFKFFLANFAVDTKLGDRSRFEPLDADFLAADLTDSERAVFDFPQRSLDLQNQLVLSIQHANRKASLQIAFCLINRIPGIFDRGQQPGNGGV
jgi:hypothetical protein